MYPDIPPTSVSYRYGLATFIKVQEGARDTFIDVLGEVATVACQTPAAWSTSSAWYPANRMASSSPSSGAASTTSAARCTGPRSSP